MVEAVEITCGGDLYCGFVEAVSLVDDCEYAFGERLGRPGSIWGAVLVRDGSTTPECLERVQPSQCGVEAGWTDSRGIDAGTEPPRLILCGEACDAARDGSVVSVFVYSGCTQ